VGGPLGKREWTGVAQLIDFDLRSEVPANHPKNKEAPLGTGLSLQVGGFHSKRLLSYDLFHKSDVTVQQRERQKTPPRRRAFVTGGLYQAEDSQGDSSHYDEDRDYHVPPARFWHTGAIRSVVHDRTPTICSDLRARWAHRPLRLGRTKLPIPSGRDAFAGDARATKIMPAGALASRAWEQPNGILSRSIALVRGRRRGWRRIRIRPHGRKCRSVASSFGEPWFCGS
jgi:hypothetical protein